MNLNLFDNEKSLSFKVQQLGPIYAFFSSGRTSQYFRCWFKQKTPL